MENLETYQGRYQSLLKHRLLKEYLIAWGIKLGSFSRYRPTNLWYVDCFAGPWNEQDEKLADTSIYIGLEALKAAKQTWTQKTNNNKITLSAIFVEKDKKAYSSLKKFIESYRKEIDIYPFNDTFQNKIKEIEALIKASPTFIFVDPMGWQGADIRTIQNLGSEKNRDILVNFMSSFINRFKGLDKQKNIREQMKALFNLETEEEFHKLRNLNNMDELVNYYKERMQKTIDNTYVVDAKILSGNKDSEAYRLVMITQNKEGIFLFRDCEAKALKKGEQATKAAREKEKNLSKTGQQTFDFIKYHLPEGYEIANKLDIRNAKDLTLHILQENGNIYYETLALELLQRFHIREQDLKNFLMEMKNANIISISDLENRRNRPSRKTNNLISLNRENPPTISSNNLTVT